MKTAIVHDWLVTDAGAEKVLQAVLEIYPDADIFSLVDFLDEKERKNVLHGKYAYTSFIQKFPFAKKHFRNYLPLFPAAIESFDLQKYDLVISSSWAVAKGIKKSKNQMHISYCYTPVRYAWDLYDEYTGSLKQPKKFLVQAVLQYIRRWDLKTLNRVDYFIADSKFVQQRIKRIYSRDSVVIYPPVDVETFTLCQNKENFYLSASRLVPYKKTKLIVEAFNAMPDKKLVVIGEGEEYSAIKKIAKPNIILLGYQEKPILKEYMQKAKAFVYAAVEDFGIVPVEAQACGTPVIALDEGGTHETVCEGITGIHFKKQTVLDIIEAVERFENMGFDAKLISKHAQIFNKKRFKTEFQTFVERKLAK
ncbi:glycosyltransferase [Sulfurimonas hydrogeniphila]|uniref:glycosyltransferase n=1 Tax=Sulfurimonas TaxID=202746 RepID=UPI00125FAC72|nr:glycosyltransferase [Sulfurimonas hydrogeniphila]